MRLLVCALAFVGGCYSPIGDLVTTHVTAGGAVQAALDGGPMTMTTALADATVDPMQVSGTSPALVFGLIVGDDDLTGMPAKAQLLAGQAVQMTVSPTSRAQVSVHTGGRSCAATQATIHLQPDGSDANLSGDFSGGGDGCMFAGTLSAIPISK